MKRHSNHTDRDTHTYIYIHIRKYTCIYVNTHIHIHIHAHIYAHTHTHTHTIWMAETAEVIRPEVSSWRLSEATESECAEERRVALDVI